MKAKNWRMKYLGMAVAVVAGAIFAGCAREEIVGRVVTVTTTVSLGADETKALTDGGVKTFSAGDRIAVLYYNTQNKAVKATSEPLAAADISNGGKSAKYTISFTNPAEDSKEIAIVYPASMVKENGAGGEAEMNYDALRLQDGTLSSLAAYLDEAEYRFNGTVGSIPSSVSLTNKLAILKLTFTNIQSEDITGTISGLTLTIGSTEYNIARSALSSHIYVAVLPFTNSNIVFDATDGVKGYNKFVVGKTLEAGHMYPVNVLVSSSGGYYALSSPLTFEARTAGATVKFTLIDGISVEYSTDGGTWNNYSSGTPITLANIGDKVMFRGINDAYYASDHASQFSGTGECYVYGNVMSLILGQNYEIANEPLYDNAFRSLFEGCSNLYSHPSRDIVLPCTVMSSSCYDSMFKDCTHLTRAPKLPATRLACRCYGSMFYGCTNLMASPVLPAPVLVDYCYAEMFRGCSSLTSVTCLATSMTGASVDGWLKDANISGTRTFTAVNSRVQWHMGDDSGIPPGWTIVYLGMCSGKFSVSNTKKVYFSQGNLQATCTNADGNGSTPESWSWSFATYQYDYVGNNVANNALNGNGSVSAAGTVDLFGWSTDANYYGINISTNDSDYSGSFRDWGALAITNGGDMVNNGWRTLSKVEWNYLFSHSKYGTHSVHGEKGIIILPDGMDSAEGFVSGMQEWTYVSDPYWSNMECAGAVFLPAALVRSGTSVLGDGGDGDYWSSTDKSENSSYAVSFGIDPMNSIDSVNCSEKSRVAGRSVRLVKNAE